MLKQDLKHLDKNLKVDAALTGELEQMTSWVPSNSLPLYVSMVTDNYLYNLIKMQRILLTDKESPNAYVSIGL